MVAAEEEDFEGEGAVAAEAGRVVALPVVLPVLAEAEAFREAAAVGVLPSAVPRHSGAPRRLYPVRPVQDLGPRRQLLAAAHVRALVVATSAMPVALRCNQGHAPVAVQAADQWLIVHRNCPVLGRARELVRGRESVPVQALATVRRVVPVSEPCQQVVGRLQIGQVRGRAPEVVREQVKVSVIVLRSCLLACRASARQELVRNCPIKGPEFRIAWPIGPGRSKTAVPI